MSKNTSGKHIPLPMIGNWYNRPSTRIGLGQFCRNGVDKMRK